LFGLRLIATGQTDSRNGFAGAYDAELSRSVTGGGLVGVFDFFTGEKFDNYTIRPSQGFDYSKTFQVPEPSSVVLLGLGFVALTHGRFVITPLNADRCRAEIAHENCLPGTRLSSVLPSSSMSDGPRAFPAS
jgi:hypothetical protein